jgi:Dolichyl-phosphate-mannose-protein mannosyltransferase
MSAPPAPRAIPSPRRLLVLLTFAFAVLAGSAMLYTSTTFDEIVFSAAGARGLSTGDFGMVSDHPRLPQYFFGLALHLSGAHLPPEEIARAADGLPHYQYARALFWGAGNDAERIAIWPRLVGLAFGVLTVLATFFLSRRHLGEGPALFAAALVSFLPDMLAHSGVAYSDVPLTFAILGSVYALDAAVRRPMAARIALAALACAFAACVKYSGLIVVPILVALLALEAASGRWRDPAWRRAIALGVPVFALVFYGALVLVYLGDWRLAEFTHALSRSAGGAGGRDAFLWGEHYNGGRWYFFPVAIVLKTPVALHVLALLAAFSAWSAARGGHWREALAHGARAPAVGAALFLAALLVAPLNVGTRHALPLMPLLCILIAQGVAPIWRAGRGAVRVAFAVIFAGLVLSAIRPYPYFISYLSEYALGRAPYETLVDSSTDWGQGLIALRTFMREREVETVALGYWGSAPPEGYGIRFVALPSYFALQPQPGVPAQPRFIVVSATLLAGFVRSDPYAALRAGTPAAVVGGSLYVFDRAALSPAAAAQVCCQRP